MQDAQLMFQAIVLDDTIHSLVQREDRIGDRLAEQELRGATDSPYYRELESAFRVNEFAIECAQEELAYIDWLQSIVAK